MAESNPGRFDNNPTGMEDGETELEMDDIREFQINLTQKSGTDYAKQIHRCDMCMAETVLTLSLYLCYVCKVYLCEKCLKLHDKTHEFVKRTNVGRERRERAEGLLLGMRGEGTVKRGESLDRESVEVIARVNMKHEFDDDDDCNITGLCSLENKRFVAVDSGNFCIKIFCSVSNTLLRYIKLGTGPWGVTEIKVKHNFTDPDSASGGKTGISGAARGESDKHSLLAVTVPYIKQIWFIDVNNTSTLKAKTIQLDKVPWSIDFNKDKMFTLCNENFESESQYSIYILSTEGNKLKVIPGPGLPRTKIIHQLAVYKERIYLSDLENCKVLCINVEDGIIFSELTLDLGTWPTGISVDHSNGELYLCGWNRNQVYKLSPDLLEYHQLSLDKVYTERPLRLCYMNNKLFIIHFGFKRSSLDNVITVVHLLT